METNGDAPVHLGRHRVGPHPRRRALTASPRPTSKDGAERLRILIASPTVPYPPDQGFNIRAFEISRRLAVEHAVTVVAHGVASGALLAAFRDCNIGLEVLEPPHETTGLIRARKLMSLARRGSYFLRRFRTKQMEQRLAVATQAHVDLVQLEGLELVGMAAAIQVPWMIDATNIWYELSARVAAHQPTLAHKAFRSAEALKIRREERLAWSRATGVLLTSHREEKVVRRWAPASRTAVVPNGVDVDTFRPREGAVEPDTIVFTGLMSYGPNIDAIEYFCVEILPSLVRRRPKTVLLVVGKDVPARLARLAGRHVRFTDWVADVRPYLARAAVVVVPLRSGSGTRLKILEAMALARPVVSTSIGCEGIEATHGQNVILADTPSVFVDHVAHLLDNPDLASRVGQQGRKLVEARYGWDAITAELVQFYRTTIAGTTPTVQ